MLEGIPMGKRQRHGGKVRRRHLKSRILQSQGNGDRAGTGRCIDNTRGAVPALTQETLSGSLALWEEVYGGNI